MINTRTQLFISFLRAAELRASLLLSAPPPSSVAAKLAPGNCDQSEQRYDDHPPAECRRRCTDLGRGGGRRAAAAAACVHQAHFVDDAAAMRDGLHFDREQQRAVRAGFDLAHGVLTRRTRYGPI